jgi:signal transduction histidine kinase
MSTASPQSSPPAHAPAPIALRRWFALLGGAVIALIALANAWLVSSFLTERLFEREAAVAREFVQNVLVADDSIDFLVRPDDPGLRERFVGSTAHLGNMRDVLRANVYGRDGSVLWSTDPQLIGRRFGDNDELEQAMKGGLVVHAGSIADDERGKREYEGLSPDVAYFVETYIPVLRPGRSEVMGVVELYKAPLALTDAIEQGRRRVLLLALGGGLLLYVSLFWLVGRAEGTMRRQHTQLLEAETLAALGELAASVAHNIRNPLASIRSAAELTLESPAEHATEGARDIVREVDRISSHVTGLLGLANPAVPSRAPVALDRVVHDCVRERTAAFERRHQHLVVDGGLAPGEVAGDAKLLAQVLYSLLDNASEAMSEGGTCRVRLLALPTSRLRLEVCDEGAGIAPEAQAQVFRPFFTTKPRGMGLGLALARRVIDRLGGRLWLDSAPGRGICAIIELPRQS